MLHLLATVLAVATLAAPSLAGYSRYSGYQEPEPVVEEAPVELCGGAGDLCCYDAYGAASCPQKVGLTCKEGRCALPDPEPPIINVDECCSAERPQCNRCGKCVAAGEWDYSGCGPTDHDTTSCCPKVPEPTPPADMGMCPTQRGPAAGLKRCVDTRERPGQATCGLPTCAALCDEACPEQRPVGGWRPQDCDNRGGGNCKGVISALTGVDFKGGPCCGCTACGPKGFKGRGRNGGGRGRRGL